MKTFLIYSNENNVAFDAFQLEADTWIEAWEEAKSMLTVKEWESMEIEEL